MITTNMDKKALVDRFLKANLITAEEVYLLLDESQPQIVTMPYIQPIVYPNTLPYLYSPTLPWYEVGKPYCGTGAFTVDPNITDFTVTYSTLDIEKGLSSGLISYTA